MTEFPFDRRGLLKLAGGSTFVTGTAVANRSDSIDGTAGSTTVYFGSNDGDLFAVDAESGEEQWSFNQADRSVQSPIVVDGIVYFSTWEIPNTVYALDAHNGDILWSFEVDANSAPTVVDGTVYVGGGSGLYALSAEGLEQEWHFDEPETIWKPPNVIDSTAYFGAMDGKLYAVDTESGTEEWNRQLGEEIRSSPTVVDGTAYIGVDDKLCAVDTGTTEILWEFTEPTDSVNSSPTVVDGTAYIGSFDSTLYAIDTRSGDKQWEFNDPSDSIGSSPTVAEGLVFVGSDDGNLYGVDSDTGAKEFEFTPPGRVRSSPTIHDGVVYFGSWDNFLYTFDISSGSRNWIFAEATDRADGSPTVVDDPETGSSVGSRAKLGTIGHHHEWADEGSPPTGFITGETIDLELNALSDVEIEFVDAETGEIETTAVSDEDGIYGVDIPADTTFEATTEKAGYLPTTETVSVGEDETETVDFRLEENPIADLDPVVDDLFDTTGAQLDASSESAAELFVDFAGELFDDPEEYLLDALGVTEEAFQFDTDASSSEFERQISSELADRSMDVAEHGTERVLETLWDQSSDELQSLVTDGTDTLLDAEWFTEFEFDSPTDAVVDGYALTPIYQDAETDIDAVADQYQDLATDPPSDDFDVDVAREAIEEVDRQFRNRRYGVPGVVMLPDGRSFQFDQTETYAAAYEGTLDQINVADAGQTAGVAAVVAGGALAATGVAAPLGAFLVKAGTKTKKVSNLAESILKTRLAIEWGLTQVHWAVDLREIPDVPAATVDWLDEATDEGLAPADITIEDVELNLEDALIRTDYVRANRPENPPGWFPATLQSQAVEDATVTVRNDGDESVDVRITMHDQYGGGESVSNEGSMDPPIEEDPITISPNDTHTFDMEYAADHNGILNLHNMSIDAWVDGVRRDDEIVEFEVRRGITIGTGSQDGTATTTDGVRDAGIVVTTADEDHGSTLSEDDLDELRPRDERILDATLTEDDGGVTVEHTPSDDTVELEYILAAPGPAGLQVEDEAGNMTGYDPVQDVVTEEIPEASFVGPEVTPQRVRLETDGNTDYTVSVVTGDFGTASTRSVSVDAVEIPEREAVLSASPSIRNATITPGETGTVSFGIEEGGGQVAIEDLEINPGPLTRDGNELEGVEVVPAESSLDVSAGDETPATINLIAEDRLELPTPEEGTRYDGTVTIETANAGGVDLGVSVLALSTSVEGARLLGAEQSVTGIGLAPIDSDDVDGQPPAGTTIAAAYEVEIGGGGDIQLEIPDESDTNRVFAYSTGEEWKQLATGRSDGTISAGLQDASGTVEIAVVEDQYRPYITDDKRVEMGGLRTGVQDWQEGRIDTEVLRNLLDAWASGDPIE